MKRTRLSLVAAAAVAIISLLGFAPAAMALPTGCSTVTGASYPYGSTMVYCAAATTYIPNAATAASTVNTIVSSSSMVSHSVGYNTLKNNSVNFWVMTDINQAVSLGVIDSSIVVSGEAYGGISTATTTGSTYGPITVLFTNKSVYGGSTGPAITATVIEDFTRHEIGHQLQYFLDPSTPKTDLGQEDAYNNLLSEDLARLDALSPCASGAFSGKHDQNGNLICVSGSVIPMYSGEPDNDQILFAAMPYFFNGNYGPQWVEHAAELFAAANGGGTGANLYFVPDYVNGDANFFKCSKAYINAFYTTGSAPTSYPTGCTP